MNNEFKTITIIGLSQVDVSKKKKNENRCVSVTVDRCVYVSICTGAIVRSMGTAKIPKPIINIGAFV